VLAYFDLPNIESSCVYGQLKILIAYISRKDIDIDKRKKSVYNNDRFHAERRNTGDIRFTNNKVLLSYFEPSKFNMAHAIHVYDNAVAFGPRDFTANEISTL